MDHDLDALSTHDRYKLLAGLILPRPIAWVTSLDADGSVNAAPYSFFNAVGTNPAMVVLGLSSRPDGSPKDTAANIRTRGRFVVNLVDESVAQAMNRTSAPLPHDESEVERFGLPTAACPGTDIPRLADAPAALACEEHSTQRIGANHIVLGRATHLWVRPGLLDATTLHVDRDQHRPVGRMGLPGWYQVGRPDEQFEMTRPT